MGKTCEQKRKNKNQEYILYICIDQKSKKNRKTVEIRNRPKKRSMERKSEKKKKKTNEERNDKNKKIGKKTSSTKY